MRRTLLLLLAALLTGACMKQQPAQNNAPASTPAGGSGDAAFKTIHDKYVVEFLRRDAGNDVRDQRIKDLRGQPAGLPHAFEPVRTVQLDDAVLGFHPVLGSDGDVLSHGVQIGA